MQFAKCHGAGNDFVVIDARCLNLPWAERARKISERHFGVGSDGVILVAPSDGPVLCMRMFNPDGSEAEACGNGLRCFAKFAVDHGITTCDAFPVATLGGVRHVRVLRSNDGEVREVEVTMGAPRFEPGEIPAAVSGRRGPVLGYELAVGDRWLSVNLVSMGNPHAVVFVAEDVAGYPLTDVGPGVEHHPLFPARTNFEVARVMGREDIQARVWERGVGETLACGSGACAIAVAGKLLGLCDASVRVHLPGGVLTVTWAGENEEVVLRGPVEQVFVGQWPD